MDKLVDLFMLFSQVRNRYTIVVLILATKYNFLQTTPLSNYFIANFVFYPHNA